MTSEVTSLTSEEWIPIVVAAKQLGKKRQAIEQQIKTGRLDSKRMGNKNLIHVHKPSLISLYASFTCELHSKTSQVKGASIEPYQTSEVNKLSHGFTSQATLSIELQKSLSEAKHLEALLDIHKSMLNDSKREYNEAKIEIMKQKEENKALQKELVNLTKEMQAILNKESGLTSWIRTLRK